MKKLIINIIYFFVAKISKILKEESINNLTTKQINLVIRLNFFYNLAKHVHGDFIELGSGSLRKSTILANLLKYHPTMKKRLHCFDTFNGYPKEVLDKNKGFNKDLYKYDINELKKLIIKNNLFDILMMYQGLLPETLEKNLRHIKSVSLVYVDCNDFDTALSCLELIRGKLSKGAVIICDDFYEGGETKALMTFAKKYNYKINTTKFTDENILYLIN